MGSNRKYEFSWGLLGDIQLGRPNLGPTARLEAYRLITDFFPETHASGRLKEFTWYFTKNLRFGHRLAARMQNLPTLAACRDFVEKEFVKSCGF